MASERMSQVLPTVKCSDCGRDVLIRRLGDHLCSSQPPVPSLPIIPAMKDKYMKKPISPLQSPNTTNKYNHFNNTTIGGSVTPPYYNGMAKDLQRPLKDTYQDDSYADDFYKSSSSLDLRKNSNSPAPSSPVYR
ncbi:uncharacterized protein EV154DRAFT_4806 [Mucor mucedo]|uniref:uncharacterized protein n=1 Tax=Mucor mucedo TaxID=29922 RepID=UPI00221F07E4|nr:uncharacterized protein EV154DRAFT_4806 [Mucor mucedo]KAI7897395.1 hypothetical protein EV154DRAFT_4806 [Mucor mucedo]